MRCVSSYRIERQQRLILNIRNEVLLQAVFLDSPVGVEHTLHDSHLEELLHDAILQGCGGVGLKK